MDRIIYYVDLGILKNDKKKPLVYYSTEKELFVESLNEAIEKINKYVNDGNNESYGVVLKPFYLEKNETVEEFAKRFKKDIYNDIFYNIESVLYSLKKEDGKLIKHFVDYL